MSIIEQVLTAIHNFVKSKIINGDFDKVGIVLWGCGRSGGQVSNDNPLGFQGIHILYSIDVPEAFLV